MPYLTVNQRSRALALYMQTHNYAESARLLNLDISMLSFKINTLLDMKLMHF